MQEVGFDTQPAFIIRILGLFPFDANAGALLAKLKALQEQHQRELSSSAATVAQTDPFQPLVMRRRQPVLGREDAGKALKTLTNRDDAAIFVVSGTSKSGRSYTAELVNHALWPPGGAQRLGMNVALAEGDDAIVDRYEAVSYLAGSLLEQIDRRELLRSRQRAAPVPPLVDGGRDLKWLRAVVDAVVSAAANTGETWWLVLDRVTPDTGETSDSNISGAVPDGTPKSDAVDSFIQILTRKIAKLFSGHQIRLIVLGYQRDFPSDVGPAVVREELPLPASVGSREVEAFFKRFFASRGGAPQDAVDMAVTEVLDLLPTHLANTGNHLFSLNASIREVLHDLA